MNFIAALLAFFTVTEALVFPITGFRWYLDRPLRKAKEHLARARGQKFSRELVQWKW